MFGLVYAECVRIRVIRCTVIRVHVHFDSVNVYCNYFAPVLLNCFLYSRAFTRVHRFNVWAYKATIQRVFFLNVDSNVFMYALGSTQVVLVSICAHDTSTKSTTVRV